MVQEARGQGKKGTNSVLSKVFVVAIFLPLLAVLLPSVLLLGVSMLPTLATYIFDRSREKFLTIGVAALNFCGALPGLAELWMQGHDMDHAYRMLGQIYPWLAAYGAAAVAWFINMILPPFVATFLTIKTEAQIELHQRRQLRLREIWGEDVADLAEELSAEASQDDDGMVDE